MQIIWILVVGVLLYLALQHMDKRYTLKNKKPSEATPPALETQADVSPVETEPIPEESAGETAFIDMIPGLPQETRQELRQLNLTTAESIRDTSDKKLLAVKGIGPARLKQIRSLCVGPKK